jgi:hypothetical protein
MDRASYSRTMTTTQARLEAIDQELHQIQSSAAARRLLSAGQKVREVWESSSIAWRRRFVALLIEKVVINPSDTTGIAKAQRFAGR